MLPAFVDAHAHVTDTGLLLDGIDAGAASSVGELLDLVAAAARQRPGRAVLGHGWDELRLAERRPPTRAELDRAAPGAVVYLSRVDVHSALVSTPLVERAGLADLPGWDPDGRVERDAHHAARNATRTALPAAERRELQRLALRSAAAAGIAQVHEMSAPHIAPEDDLVALVRLARDPVERLPEVVAYRGTLAADVAAAKELAARLDAGFGAEGSPGVVGLAGDLIADGAVGSRTACFHEPYADTPGHRGHLYLSEEQIRDHVVACTGAGLQGGFHVIGDAAVATVVAGLAAAAELIGTDAIRAARHRLEHVEAVTPAQLAVLARLGVTASVQPAFDAAWGGPGGMYATRLGRARAAVLNPFAAFASGGVRLAFGSDSPVTPFDPWGGVRAAVRHHEEAYRLDVPTAVRAHIGGGHEAAGRDGGVLAPGAPATFAVWTPAEGGGLPDLAAGEPPPKCLSTYRNGHKLAT